MGWGCYKHEMDAETPPWKEALDKLCDRKLAETPRTFGRDGEICPLCYEELEKLARDLVEMVRHVGVLLAYKRDDCNALVERAKKFGLIE